MGPRLKMIEGAKISGGCHAHLLMTEMAGKPAPESPAAVMEEVEYRATHVSLLMEKMFAEAMKHDEWEGEEE